MKNLTFWFITGSQDMYGEKILEEVWQNSQKIVSFLNSSNEIGYNIVIKPTVKTPDEILNTIAMANADNTCAGIITWMHTFSPSKMWINGLKILNKPMLHLHTQFNQEIPWDSIDMDFMNTNQSAHGDREHGFICTRMDINRKVIAGHYKNPDIAKRMGEWMSVAAVTFLGNTVKIMRFGDNMREVAVTEGDKVEAQIKFGWHVNSYGVGGLAEKVNNVSEKSVDSLMDEYKEKYDMSDIDNDEKMNAVRYQAKLEIAIKDMLEKGGFGGFTNTFEDLYGLDQLSGLATQRLMEAGYGFGPEGDWKLAAMTRIMKMMASNKGTSMMEDYTYHMEPGNEAILGSHMLEVCPTLAADKPRIEVHPLGIGGANPPARLKFKGKKGSAICISLIQLTGRMRLIVLDVDAIDNPNNMPKLPVASVLWKPQPSLSISAEAWIYAGGAHHTVLSYVVTAEQMIDWAEMVGIECVHINKDTTIPLLKQELMINEIIWKFCK